MTRINKKREMLVFYERDGINLLGQVDMFNLSSLVD